MFSPLNDLSSINKGWLIDNIKASVRGIFDLDSCHKSLATLLTHAAVLLVLQGLMPAKMYCTNNKKGLMPDLTELQTRLRENEET